MEQEPNFLKRVTKPTLEGGILVLHLERYGGLDYFEKYFANNRKDIYDYMLTRYMFSVRAGEDTIDLFYIDESNVPLTAQRKDWKFSLERMLSFYIDWEEYEKCAVCKQLIDILDSETESN